MLLYGLEKYSLKVFITNYPRGMVSATLKRGEIKGSEQPSGLGGFTQHNSIINL